jgi:hypothetical protein
VLLEELGKSKESNDLIGNRTPDRPQPTTLPRAPLSNGTGTLSPWVRTAEMTDDICWALVLELRLPGFMPPRLLYILVAGCSAVCKKKR